MNERIKQLAIEAKLIAPEYNGFDHTRLSISQQKFAQLIVQECARLCDINDKEQGDILREHFGVVE